MTSLSKPYRKCQSESSGAIQQWSLWPQWMWSVCGVKWSMQSAVVSVASVVSTCVWCRVVYAVCSGHCGLSGFDLCVESSSLWSLQWSLWPLWFRSVCGVEWSVESPVVSVASVVSICVWSRVVCGVSSGRCGLSDFNLCVESSGLCSLQWSLWPQWFRSLCGVEWSMESLVVSVASVISISVWSRVVYAVCSGLCGLSGFDLCVELSGLCSLQWSLWPQLFLSVWVVSVSSALCGLCCVHLLSFYWSLQTLLRR